uniref:Single domain camelid nanobody VHH T10 n=1 Tax=Lama glama TaxID=9844 RepID=UPI000D5032EA|nr:Chain A, Single domain camelid nanobody VHH T10 [Lama glama]5VM4_B Chain B, Single domain camelid nanobody VHH T10 [Lama glama]5VM4_C Chain C, Single domain camelid nanobody VHH T10 [Lama glama]5VM4_D Chain D, Single domain camelid nanobody VHH T10 [Lama glama]5VM4_E Chain E, Single domain camelid nanobody VHH T10 [Lama glama]5VM4_F Chain F, Single domain camelid nanobody VHH T10 [Lama glama]5VM4_G Chain G, Single domain camelid nanobody VHH T10 [Lama glama]5VM4_H Chain H, Single domain c
MAQVKLQQSGGGMVQTGDSLRLSCVGSRRALSSTIVGWFRQIPGKEREFVGGIAWSSSDTWYADSVKGRFTISKDDAANGVHLQMSSLKPEDTAVYYCASALRRPGSDASDYTRIPDYPYWGQGTQVTVSSHHHHHH